jgi:hypothetical protein
MGWVTLDDGQHVYIGAGGKVLATRSAISSAGGGKERGKALAARSKAAIGKVKNKTGAELSKIQSDSAAVHEKESQRLQEQMRNARKSMGNKPSAYQKAEYLKIQAEESRHRIAAMDLRDAAKQNSGQQSPAHPVPGARRAIEHAKAAGPSLREQADAARAAKGTRDERIAKILEKAERWKEVQDQSRQPRRKIAELEHDASFLSGERQTALLKRAGSEKKRAAALYELSRPRIERISRRVAGLRPR